MSIIFIFEANALHIQKRLILDSRDDTNSDLEFFEGILAVLHDARSALFVRFLFDTMQLISMNTRAG